MAEMNLSTVYDPFSVEEKWYKWWEERGFFRADEHSAAKPFSIVIPPPNVTGYLHMGHALNDSIQDLVIRMKRMQGYATLWMPGTDHAGIATQNVVERALAKEGLTRHDLGRDKFIERVWDWRKEYGGTIIRQLKRLGASCDWERERFTMDPGLSSAVREVFVALYEKGLIYRGSYIVNWCPRCGTSLSDIEVEHEQKAGHLWHLKYPFADGSGYLVVATTRPETMLGDTGVAVHPEDPRFQSLIGKMVILPLVNREIPIFADDYVDPTFGTGCVKVTPAHDPNDFEMGLRHNLAQVVVISENGTMTELAGEKYQGMDRYDCRKAVIADLETAGVLVKVDDHEHNVGECSRCRTVVEPLISAQWFVSMKPLAEPAAKVVQDGQIRFIPERFNKTYLDWLDGIRDWCISRQLWWGHRIPVWYCQDCGYQNVSRQDPTSCNQCGSTQLEQDPDVLDTWFSSALWPFSTMGWPEQTDTLKKFYPTSVLITSYDIIFFWVARMVFMGLEFTDEIPFPEVYMNGLVRDANGKKMSKSSGTAVDPIEIMDQYGADTLRFTMLATAPTTADMRLHTEKFEVNRNFCNKIWNASRFTIMNLEGFYPGAADQTQLPLELADRWILSRYHRMLIEADQYFENYLFAEAGKLIYDFLWSEFCDWYIELAKSRLYDKENPLPRLTAQYTLWTVLKGTLELLHPFMPFITEEIWQNLPHNGETIMLTPWPKATAGMVNDETEATMELIIGIIREIRYVRNEMSVPPGKKAEIILHPAGLNEQVALEAGKSYVAVLGHGSAVTIDPLMDTKPEKAATAVVSGVDIFLPLKDMIDFADEVRRLEKELASLKGEVARLEGKLGNASFVAKAPADVIEKERIKLTDYQQRYEKVAARLIEVREL